MMMYQLSHSSEVVVVKLQPKAGELGKSGKIEINYITKVHREQMV